MPAQYLLACTNGHLDEFPYDAVGPPRRHLPERAAARSEAARRNVGQGAGAIITCERCQQRRGMSEAQGAVGKRSSRRCRGRHPHLNAFDPACGLDTALIMMGASNLWFASTQSIIVMPRTEPRRTRPRWPTSLQFHLGSSKLTKYAGQTGRDPRPRREQTSTSPAVTDEELAAAVAEALAPSPSEEERQEKLAAWDPVELLVPEWRLPAKAEPVRAAAERQRADGHRDAARPRSSRPGSHRVIAVNRMKKVNAVLGFTRSTRWTGSTTSPAAW